MKINSLIAALLFAVTGAFAQVPSYVPTNGLVGWWPFNGNANDESGNGNNGTVNGATLTSDRFGNSNEAYYFSSAGCGTRIDVSVNTSSIQTGLTISIWAMRSSTGCIGPRLLEFGPVAGDAGAVQWIWDNANYTRFGACTSTGTPYNSSFNSVGLNTWTNLIFTNNGQYAKFYQDGVLIDSLIITSGSAKLASNGCFGRMNHPAYDAFNGKLDDIGIWNRALSASEIQQLYTAQAPCTLTSNFFATDTVSACDNSVSLNAQNPGANFLWSNNATTQSITANATGWYKCTVSQGTTCSVSDSVYVKLPNALPASLQAGLVGYWPFCGNANDESGNGNNGTVNGATLTSDRFGNLNSAYSFNNSEITTNLSSMQFSADYTISIWVRVNSNTEPYPTFLTGNNVVSGMNGNYLVVQLYQNKFLHYMEIAPGNSGLVLYQSNVISLNNWYHLTISNKNHVCKMYIDGVEDNTISPIYLSNVGSYLHIGNGRGSGEIFIGQLDDICIWNRALTTSEVQQLYATQSGNTASNSNSNSSSSSSINNLPKGISYQAVARDSASMPLSNANVEVRFTLRDSSITGPVVYKEVHTLTTNQFGLFTTAIGSGVAQTGDYNSINWMGPAKYLDVEIKQGANYLLMGSQQLLAVPYANASATSGEVRNAQIPVYNDNAAALAGGLKPGQMYRTNVGVLMIVY